MNGPKLEDTMILRMILFGVVASTIWIGVHFYIGHRLIHQTRVRATWRPYAWSVVGLHAVLAPIAFFWRRAHPEGAIYEALNLVTYIGMGFTFTLLIYLLVKDIIHLMVVASDRLRSRQPSEPDQERRNLLAGSFNLGAFAVAGVSSAKGYRNATKPPAVEEVEVPVEGLPRGLDGFTIVQLSDLHIGPTLRGDFLDAIVDRVNELDADAIAITGDLIDGYVEDLAAELTGLDRLEAREGVFFVTGNHEYYWDGPAWARFIESKGIRVLLNDHQLVERGDARLLVGGVTDYRAERQFESHATDPFKAIEDAPEHDFSLLLAHQPTSVYNAKKAGWDMQISGHTHGGQFFPWNLFVGLYHEFSAGLDRLDDMWIYVSRGAGYWGPPNRHGAPSEITHITLKRAA